MNSSTYIVKRFYDIGKGASNVSPSENGQNLLAELIQAKQGQWFLDAFYNHASKYGSEVFSGKSEALSFNHAGRFTTALYMQSSSLWIVALLKRYLAIAPFLHLQVVHSSRMLKMTVILTCMVFFGWLKSADPPLSTTGVVHCPTLKVHQACRHAPLPHLHTFHTASVTSR